MFPCWRIYSSPGVYSWTVNAYLWVAQLPWTEWQPVYCNIKYSVFQYLLILSLLLLTEEYLTCGHQILISIGSKCYSCLSSYSLCPPTKTLGFTGEGGGGVGGHYAKIWAHLTAFLSHLRGSHNQTLEKCLPGMPRLLESVWLLESDWALSTWAGLDCLEHQEPLYQQGCSSCSDHPFRCQPRPASLYTQASRCGNSVQICCF